MVWRATDFLLIIECNANYFRANFGSSRFLDFRNRNETELVYGIRVIFFARLVLTDQFFKIQCPPVRQLDFCIFGETTPVSLAVNQRVAKGKILRHAHHRVINCNVAVRMIFSENVSDYRRRFSEFCRMPQTEFVHGIQNPPMDRFQTVPDIRKRARHYNRHRVVKVGFFHLSGYFTRLYFANIRHRKIKVQKSKIKMTD